MLKERDVEFTYREYTEEPLDLAELKDVFSKLGMVPSELLRARDAKTVGLSGNESEAALMELMAEHPTLLQRPIGIVGKRAVLGRPAEELLSLL